jgi:hypothetical protein
MDAYTFVLASILFPDIKQNCLALIQIMDIERKICKNKNE